MAASLTGCESNSEAGAAAAQAGHEAVPLLATFHDLTTSAVEELVGEPDFRRVEPPAELWQYRSTNCVVDLFFYGEGDNRRVVLADARGRDRRSDQRCGDGTEVWKSRLRIKPS